MPTMDELLHLHHSAKTGIPGKDFVASQAGQRHLHSRRTCLLRDDIGIQAIHGRLVHRSKRLRYGYQRILLRQRDLMMVRVEPLRYGARKFRLVEFVFTKHQRERARTRASRTQQRYQAAGVYTARKKYTDRNIADQLQAYRVS